MICNQSLYHRSLRKKPMYLFKTAKITHTIYHVQHRSQLTAFSIQHIDWPLKWDRSFASYFYQVSKKAFSARNVIISYLQEIKLRGDNLAARSLSACKHCKIHVNTVRIQNSSESIKKASTLNEIPRRRDYQNEINLI